MEKEYEEVEKLTFTPLVLSEPWECFINCHLSDKEKRFLNFLLATCQSEEGCKLTNKFLTGHFDCCESTINNSISKLRSYGYIIVEVHCSKTKDGSFKNERAIFNNPLYPLIYQNAVQFYHSYSSMLPAKTLWKEIEKRLPSEKGIEALINAEPNMKKLIFGRPNMKKFIDNINNNIDTISSSFNKLKERRNEDSANLSFLDPSDSHLEEKKPSIGANSDIKVVKKLKRRNLQVEPASIPTAKPETKPEEKKPSLKEMASAGMKENAQKQTKPRKVVVPIQRVREEVSLLMEYWGELGFHLPSEKANGAYNNNVRSLEKIMKGTLIPSEKRKFTPEDIRISMCRLKQIVFDKEYGPSQVIKDILSKIDLNAFLYNPYAKTTSSWFLVCLKEEPKKNFDPSIAEDKHPIITNRLRSFYFKYALAGMKSNLTPREESKFREGANKLCEIYDRYRQRFAGINGYTEFSDIFCQAMKHSYGNKTTMIHPSTFNTSNSRATMIAFMNEMGYIPDADFQVDF